MTAPSPRPVLVFDGDCGFCRRWIRRWQRATGDAVEYAPYQEAAPRFPRVPASRFSEAVHLIEPDGRVTRGAEAVFRSLASARLGRVWLKLYAALPPFAWASERVYAFVASHRVLASRLTDALWGPSDEPPTFALSRWLFTRAVAAVYLIAFASLLVQADGLFGPQGISPLGPWLEAVEKQLGAARWHAVPTLAWLGLSLPALCKLGLAASLLALAGVFQGPLLLALWALYLSVVSIGGDFLAFQWDNLLLEAGLLTAFYAPWRPLSRLKSDGGGPPLARLLVLWLLFRLMFQSGAVKLLSADRTWWDLTALRYHFETQPLPTWPAWYLHQLPPAALKVFCASMFAIELGLPFLIVLPRLPRLAAFFGLTGLMALIAVSGNYTFFNLLAAALCLPLVDDVSWGWMLPKRLGERLVPPPSPSTGEGVWSRTRHAAFACLAGGIFFVGLAQTWATFRGFEGLPGVVRSALVRLSPLRTFNNYGLFAMMTTTRPEIVIEGSDDGSDWKAYGFRYKPGELADRPRWVAPHQPRLDWQMWFAALGAYDDRPWFLSFLARLLEGSPPVRALLAVDPFPDAPPRYIRARLYYYRFTDAGSGAAWWKREEKGLYAPVVTLTR